MVKKVIVVMVLFALMLSPIVSVSSFAQTTPGPTGTATATVPSYLEFAMSEVRKVTPPADDPWSAPKVTPASFDFGTLVPVNDTSTPPKFLYMRGQFFYVAIMIASTSGRRYKITQTGTQLSTGGTTPKLLARESVLLVPDYQEDDAFDATKPTTTQQGPIPAGASVGSATTASSATESLIYQSDSLGFGRIIRANIAIGGPLAGETYPCSWSSGHDGTTGKGTKLEYTAWKPVGKDQAAGAYTGTMTFTLTLN